MLKRVCSSNKGLLVLVCKTPILTPQDSPLSEHVHDVKDM